MFFESALSGKNQWWRYLVMFIAAFAASNIIGALPLIIIMVTKAAQDPSILEKGSENMADLSTFGIDPNFGLVLMILPFIVGLLTIVMLMKPLNNRTFRSVINGGENIRWQRVFFSFFLWAFLAAIYLFVYMKVNPANFVLNNISKSLIPLIFISLILIPFQTSFEEVLFRGYLMQGLGVAFRNKWWPLIITSILFGLMHGLNPEIKEFGFFTMMPQYISFGLLFGLVTVLDNGIELAIGAHAANNVFLSIFLTQESSTLQTVAVYEQKDVFPWMEYLFLVVISVLFVVILARVYNWKFRESFKFRTN